MAYATPQDLLEMFGVREMAAISRPDYIATKVPDALFIQAVAGGDLASWSSTEQEAVAACLARIDRILADAQRTVNSYLANRYSLPIADAVVAVSPLRGICGDIARYLLYDDKAIVQVKERHDAAILWLRDVAAGRATLPRASLPPTGGLVGMILVTPGQTFFGSS